MLDLNLDYDLLDYEEDDELLSNEELLNDKDFLDDKKPDIKDKTEIMIKTQKSFRDFLLKQELLRAISDAGFESPSEVQNECIPQAIMGVDILCQAKSGMGKTCVFVLSTLQQLDIKCKKISVLVLVHTRELAFQISKEYERFAKYLKANVAVFIGGIPQRIDEQVLQYNRPHVAVATTGRLKGLIREGIIDLSQVRHLVIDEFDKMLQQRDLLEDIIFIDKRIPRNRQIMMFSATMTEQNRRLAIKLMDNPLEVIIGDDSKLSLHGLQQFYVELPEREKLRKLNDILSNLEYKQAIVFVNTIQRCKALNDVLLKLNFSVINIHSAMSQEERLNTYQIIKSYKRRVLIATKLFDRGIDFERVDVVINYDMPDNSDIYLHAVGRAGRFGTKGVAISLISGYAADIVRQQVQTRFDIKLEPLPDTIVI